MAGESIKMDVIKLKKKWSIWVYLLKIFNSALINEIWAVKKFLTIKGVLTLIDMRGDTFISLSFLGPILSAEFLSKIS